MEAKLDEWWTARYLTGQALRGCFRKAEIEVLLIDY